MKFTLTVAVAITETTNAKALATLSDIRDSIKGEVAGSEMTVEDTGPGSFTATFNVPEDQIRDEFKEGA